jgi:hypothetical protein
MDDYIGESFAGRELLLELRSNLACEAAGLCSRRSRRSFPIKGMTGLFATSVLRNKLFEVVYSVKAAVD